MKSKSKISLSCFKSYDIRGKLGEEINEHTVKLIGRAVTTALNAEKVVLGHDSRNTSPKFSAVLAKSIIESGADVIDIGLAGTEEMYWAVTEFQADAGLAVTASHNPIDYNGIKIVKKASRPLSSDEFLSIKEIAESGDFSIATSQNKIINKSFEARSLYVRKVLSFVDVSVLRPLKIVVNSGNGAAGPTFDQIEKFLIESGVTFECIKINHDPDGSFPNGIPNPILVENQSATSSIIKKEQADFGIAFDGDFDRCFLFDGEGNFIPSEYIVGLFSELFLSKDKEAVIVHDPRVIWNIEEIVNRVGGNAVISRTGHAFMKQVMRDEEACYGGEMSAHHYFQQFAYCDSGMIPWLLVWQIISRSGIPLKDLVSERSNKFPSSGEINFKVFDPNETIKLVEENYLKKARTYNFIDGLSLSFSDWRFNLRASNTEPLIRLNVETIESKTLLDEKTKELTDFLYSRQLVMD